MRARYALPLLLLVVGRVGGRPQTEEQDQEEDREDDEEEDVEYDYDLVGADGESEFSLGLIEPAEKDRVDEESVGFFNLVGTSLNSAPDSYSSLKLGLLTPVKNQGKCGACAAYATAAVIETCFKKLTGKIFNISAQQFLDCAFDWESADACKGSPLHSYMNWGKENQPLFGSEKQYPYKGIGSPFTCPSPLPVTDVGAKLTSSFYTYEGTEDQLKDLIYQHGAAVIGVFFSKASLKKFVAYKRGIFDGCDGSRDAGGHAMVAVGYGREKGKDYWLVRNSWGPKWGEKGYVKIRRGTGACGFGEAFALVECAATPKRKTKTKKKKKKNRVTEADEEDEEEDEEDEEYDEEVEYDYDYDGE